MEHQILTNESFNADFHRKCNNTATLFRIGPNTFKFQIFTFTPSPLFLPKHFGISFVRMGPSQQIFISSCIYSSRLRPLSLSASSLRLLPSTVMCRPTRLMCPNLTSKIINLFSDYLKLLGQ